MFFIVLFDDDLGGIQEGRAAAVEIDNYLMKNNASRLPITGSIKLRDLSRCAGSKAQSIDPVVIR